jgi:hypothetical protein
MMTIARKDTGELIEIVGGVDTHQDTHTAAVVDGAGRLLVTAHRSRHEARLPRPVGVAALVGHGVRGYRRVWRRPGRSPPHPRHQDGRGSTVRTTKPVAASAVRLDRCRGTRPDRAGPGTYRDAQGSPTERSRRRASLVWPDSPYHPEEPQAHVRSPLVHELPDLHAAMHLATAMSTSLRRDRRCSGHGCSD